MATWIQQTAPTVQGINHVYGFGPFDVYAVGNLGTILHWNGSSWASLFSGVGPNINRVWGYSNASVWAVGAGGVLLNTVNQGQTWNPVNTLNAAVGFQGNYVGIWGSSARDFWVLENTNGGSFWHTTNGGVSWALSATGAASWTHLWGATGAAIPYIMAVGTTGPSGTVNAAALAYFNGTGWTSKAEAAAQLDGYGCWPGPSAQNYTCGQSATGVTAASIRDWSLGYTASVYDQVPTGLTGASRFRAIYGSDLVNLYAAGVAGTTGVSAPLLAQASVVGTPSVSGAWAGVTLPASLALSGGLSTVFADPSGYAVAAGAAGIIVARSGATLAMGPAVAIATNTVQVTFAAAPLAQSVIGTNDALNPASWTILRADTGATFPIMNISQVSGTVFNVSIYDRFAGSLVQHLVATPTLLDPYGNTISGSPTAAFQGVLADAQATQDAQSAANRYVLSDVANPPIPLTGNSDGGGVRIITQTGDFATESGNNLLKKLILRRLSTSPGGFFHLPTYGVGNRVKEKLNNADFAALKKNISDQVLLEPEVTNVSVTALQDPNTGAVTFTIRVATASGTFEMEV